VSLRFAIAKAARAEPSFEFVCNSLIEDGLPARLCAASQRRVIRVRPRILWFRNHERMWELRRAARRCNESGE